MEVWKVTPRGKPVPTRDVVHLVRDWGIREADLRPALLWNGAPVGVAEASYPHPAGWRIAGSPPGHTFEHMTVRRLTAAYRDKDIVEPSCVSAWKGKLGECNMEWVLQRVCSPLVTPRDFKNWYRILHRSIRTRNTVKGADVNCRLCNECIERLSHLAECRLIREVFEHFREFASHYLPGLILDSRLIYLGLTGPWKGLPSALSALHIIVWKFVVIAFTRAETENAKFVPDRIWSDAVRRFSVRINAHCERVRLTALKRRNSGDGYPTELKESANATLEPVARLSEDGDDILFSEPYQVLLKTKHEERVRRAQQAHAKRVRREHTRRAAPRRARKSRTG